MEPDELARIFATEFRQSEMHYRRWTTTLRPGAWEKSGER